MNAALHSRRGTREAGFSVAEVLVATAVFVLMMGMLAQMLSTTTKATHVTHQEVDASDYTRQVLDSLGMDFENIAAANGLGLIVSQDANNNSIFAFLSESRGPSDSTDTRFMAVAYQLTGTSLMRSVSTVPWSTTQLASATLAATNSPTAAAITPSALRFQAALLLDNGSIVPLSQSVLDQTQTWKTSTFNGEALPSGYYSLVLSSPPIDPNNARVSGILVAVAALDSQSIKIPGTSQMGASLQTPTGSQTPIDAWETNRSASTFIQKYPAPAVEALSLDQQIYPLR